VELLHLLITELESLSDNVCQISPTVTLWIE
jgi:hypothetical protein